MRTGRDRMRHFQRSSCGLDIKQILECESGPEHLCPESIQDFEGGSVAHLLVASFDLAQVSAMQSSPFGKCGLRKAQTIPEFA